VLALGAVAAGCGDGGTDSDAGPATAVAPVAAELLAGRDALEPGGATEIALRFALPRPWHLYWSGRNDTGVAPRVTWQLPPGYAVGGFSWPAPERYVSAGDILDHVHFDELVLVAPLTVPADAVPGETVTLRASVRWLACAEVCVPGSGEVELTLPVVAPGRAGTPPPETAAALARARTRWPRPAEAPGGPRWTWEGTTFVVRADGAARLAFYPHEDCVELADLLGDGAADGSELRLRTGPTAGVETSGVHGVLAVHGAGDEPARFWTINAPGPDRSDS
jgi:thiol:disulfide interchange protein DsbD